MMEDMQTDTLCNFENKQDFFDNHGEVNGGETNSIIEKTGLSHEPEILDETNCDVNSESSASINSDAWKDSDNEEDSFENKMNNENVNGNSKMEGNVAIPNGLDSNENDKDNNTNDIVAKEEEQKNDKTIEESITKPKEDNNCLKSDAKDTGIEKNALENDSLITELKETQASNNEVMNPPEDKNNDAKSTGTEDIANKNVGTDLEEKTASNDEVVGTPKDGSKENDTTELKEKETLNDEVTNPLKDNSLNNDAKNTRMEIDADKNNTTELKEKPASNNKASEHNYSVNSNAKNTEIEVDAEENDVTELKEKEEASIDEAPKDNSLNNSSEKDTGIEEIDTTDVIEKEASNDEVINISDDKKSDTVEPTNVNINCDEEMQTESDADGREDIEVDIEDDDNDDFDPLLLCPEVSMAIDEAPVITNGGSVPNDGSSSPLPYEPVFSTYVDEMTGAEVSFNLTVEEQEFRQRMFGTTSPPVQYTKVHCTACNVHLGSALEAQKNRFVHPMLKVLICKECYHFYTSGEFEKDEDGSELYCRWCGQGGQVICCSKCEFVFCKKCIRNNFGRRKLADIRDSDEWSCFRCAPTQLMNLRIACVELFEYVRREISRAATLNDPLFLSEDHTRCCSGPPLKRKLNDLDGELENKKKKRRIDHDPDYDPISNSIINQINNLPSTSTFTTTGFLTIPTAAARKEIPNNNINNSINITTTTTIPKYIVTPVMKDNDVEFVGRIPAQTVQPARLVLGPSLSLGITKPRVSATVVQNSAVRPVIPTPGFIRIGPPSLRKISNQPTTTQTTNLLKSRLLNNNHAMKHEWFEKTVRAAARVNSHLSYTLTQLNKAQAGAGNVEELAVVHNKLQEILSSSINSLIQIRKNLRTEFIAGIKRIRFPPKQTETISNDDDVIFVSTPTLVSIQNTPKITMPIVSTIMSTASIKNNMNASTSKAKTPFLVMNPTSNAFNLTNKILIASSSSTSDNIGLNATNNINTDSDNSCSSVCDNKPKAYLKVKTVSELQHVPFECITIPDDPLAIPIDLEKETTEEGEDHAVVEKSEEKKSEDNNKEEVGSKEKCDVINMGKGKEALKVLEEKDDGTKAVKDDKEESQKDSLKIVENLGNSTKEKTAKGKTKLNKSKDNQENELKKSSRVRDNFSKKSVYNLNDIPTAEIKRMLSVKVTLERCDLNGVLNGNSNIIKK